MPKLSLLLVLLALLLAGPLATASAQEAEPVTRFLIETITVEGSRSDSAAAIVKAETRLKEGESYSEPELRQAIYRVKRLPFVLDAEFALRKGSERGAYELAVTIEPTRPVFFLVQNDARTVAGFRFASDFSSVSSYGSVGARQFLGTNGLLFASVSKGEGSEPDYQAGYTRYNLFGNGSFATVGVFHSPQGVRGDFNGANFTFGIPLTGNHSLRSSLEMTRADAEHPLFGRQRGDAWRGELSWIYDTTDDPLLPTQGTRLDASVGYARSEASFFLPGFPDFVQRLEGEESFISVTAQDHYRLTPRQSLEVRLVGGYQEARSQEPGLVYENSARGAAAGVMHSVSVWGFEKTERIGDLRLENGLRIDYFRHEDHVFGGSDQYTATVTSSLIFRNAWGIVRLTAAYTEY